MLCDLRGGLSAWLLELVILISWYLQKYSDMAVVAGLLAINALLSFFEELQAEKSLNEVKAKLSVNSRVLRSSLWSVVAARELVPGDVVRVRSGDFIPADVKIFRGNITVDQASLTGESGAISKTAGDNLFSGSVVKRGEANGIAVATGTNTFFGKTTQLIQLARPKLHIEEIISGVVQRLVEVVSILVIVTLGYIAYKRMPVLEVLEVLPLMLVVLLSAIPVALPVMMTVTTALGARDLSRRGVLVTRLNASEDAAMVDVICVDKTGTLTFNKLALIETVAFEPYDEAALLKYSVVASQEADQDPIDNALIGAAKARSISLENVTVNRFSPFSPETRRTEAFFQEDGKSFKVIKGAVGTIMKFCNFGETELQVVQAKVAELTAAGNKVLAVALADEGQEYYSLVGLVGLRDAPRPDSKQLIEEARQLGISFKMLTGDALFTARKVAEQVGISGDLGTIMVAEAGTLIYLCINWLGISPNGEAIRTYSFVVLFFFAIFSLLSVREEEHFWQSKPSKILSLALAADVVVALSLSLVGVPGLVSLDWTIVAVIIAYAFVFSLVINDFVKVFLLRSIAK